MKGYRFYLEFDSTYAKRKGKHSGNVTAVTLEDGKPLYTPRTDNVDAVGGVYAWPNSACAGVSASREWLHKNCKRVSESKAREVHPNLFRYLEGGGQ